jgi:hypothetical protein
LREEIVSHDLSMIIGRLQGERQARGRVLDAVWRAEEKAPEGAFSRLLSAGLEEKLAG